MTDRRFAEIVVENRGCFHVTKLSCDSCSLSFENLGKNSCEKIGSLKAAEYWLSQNSISPQDIKTIMEKVKSMSLDYYGDNKDYSMLINMLDEVSANFLITQV